MRVKMRFFLFSIQRLNSRKPSKRKSMTTALTTFSERENYM